MKTHRRRVKRKGGGKNIPPLPLSPMTNKREETSINSPIPSFPPGPRPSLNIPETSGINPQYRNFLKRVATIRKNPYPQDPFPVKNNIEYTSYFPRNNRGFQTKKRKPTMYQGFRKFTTKK
jgi:hypothetical protein